MVPLAARRGPLNDAVEAALRNERDAVSQNS
jgi:hypothetical protein